MSFTQSLSQPTSLVYCTSHLCGNAESVRSPVARVEKKASVHGRSEGSSGDREVGPAQPCSLSALLLLDKAPTEATEMSSLDAQLELKRSIRELSAWAIETTTMARWLGPSTVQRGRFKELASAWQALAESRLASSVLERNDGTAADALVTWLKTKQAGLQQALRDGTALYIDVLLLGIVSDKVAS